MKPTGEAWLEALGAAATLAACFALGRVTGWSGVPRGFGSTMFWPFFTDTWFPKTVWSGRALLPLVPLALAWPALRRWLRGGDDAIAQLVGLVACVYLVHLCIGFVRWGAQGGLTLTFRRPQEYWNDVPLVVSGFLARFPDLRLSQHGGTHPPGIILVLAFLKWLGFVDPLDVELLCTPAAAACALPLWGAARRLTDEDSARWAVALFLFTWSVMAFAVLSMDTIILFLATLSFYGFVRALDGELWGGAILGLSLGAAVLCSFLALTLPLTWLVILWSRRDRVGPPVWRALALAVAVFLAFYGVLWAAFGYRPFYVLRACMNGLRHSEDARRSRVRALLSNPLAFLGSLGIPFMGLCAHAIGTALARVRRRAVDDVAWLLFAALAPVVVNTLAGLPRAELERIYMPFLPALAVAVGAAARRWYDRPARWFTHFAAPIAVAQAIAVEIFLDTYW